MSDFDMDAFDIDALDNIEIHPNINSDSIGLKERPTELDALQALAATAPAVR